MQVRNIPIAEIVPSELNPRKTFNQEELEELAQSIKENGLVQPITLRKLGNKKDSKYEIVCGERRFRACQLIGATTIQAIVKELNDKQAFACMIIENLQRKDIDPMEEAAALNKLFNEGSMTVAEMAKMLGKSTSFVFGRIQLHNTIPQFVDLMRNGPLVLTHLLDICKLPTEQQEILYNACFTEECRARWTYKFPNMPQLHEMIDEHVMNYLDKARFSMTDDTFANAPACESCPLNTKNNPDNFKDVNSPRCLKRACFLAKTQETIFRKAKELAPTHQLVFSGAYPTNEEILRAAEDYGLIVVGMGNRQYVMRPAAPDESQYKDEETYAKRLASYNKVNEVFEDNLKDGTVIPVYEICFDGHLSGEIKYVFCAPDSQEEPLTINKVEDNNRRISELKIKLRETNEKRKEEFVEKQRAFLETSGYSGLNIDLSAREMEVFIALIFKRLPTAFKDSIGCEAAHRNDYRKAKVILTKNYNAIVREFLRSVLSEKSVNFSEDLANMLSAIMDERYANQVDEIAKSLDARYNLSKTNIQSKIDELREENAKEKGSPAISPTEPASYATEEIPAETVDNETKEEIPAESEDSESVGSPEESSENDT